MRDAIAYALGGVADRDVFLPRLGRMLAERNPEIPDVDMSDWESARAYNEQFPAAVLEEWAGVRRALLAGLAPLARGDWARVGLHAVRGPFPLAEMVRYWGDHDLAHRRQIAEALGELA